MQSIDYSESDQHDQDEYDKSIAKGGVTTPFPWKLHDMLDDMDRQGTHSVVTWQPHGRAFMVHKPKDFVDKIMKHYFNQTKVSIRAFRCWNVVIKRGLTPPPLLPRSMLHSSAN